jgi:predicted TIM-barrel fold metal-dependent hydrolase
MSATTSYTVISSDCHAGGNHAMYREYLSAEHQAIFDDWRGEYSNPFRDLQDDGRSRNWDNERRQNDLYADGVVAEVVFPNTVPPFFPTGVVIAPAPKPDEFEMRLAGIRAHNRWLADFVAEFPKQRLGLTQIFLNDVDEAVADIRWGHDHGLRGMLLPGASPDTPWIEQLSSPVYDPIWDICQELGIVVTHHAGGSGIPEYPDIPLQKMLFMQETPFFANRALWHMYWGGVFERFPRLRLALTEQGSAWVPPTLTRMESLYRTAASGRVGELGIPADALPSASPKETMATNIWIGASFPSPGEAEAFHDIGIDRVMWGSDYPHNEGTAPFSRQSLQRTFSTFDEEDLRKVLSLNAAQCYGFDLDALAPLAAEHGPTVDEVKTPLAEIPKGAVSPAFHRP